MVLSRLRPILMSVLIIAVLVGALVQVPYLQSRAQIFPLIIIIPTLVLALAQLVMDRRQAWRTAPTLASQASEERAEAAEVSRRAIQMLAWALGVLAGVYFIGLNLALGLFVFVYLLLEARRSLRFSLLSGVAMFLVLYLVMDQQLHLLVPTGVLFTWLGL